MVDVQVDINIIRGLYDAGHIKWDRDYEKRFKEWTPERPHERPKTAR